MSLSNRTFFENNIILDARGDIKEQLNKLPNRRGVILFVNPAGSPVQLLACSSLRTVARSKLAAEKNTISRKIDLRRETAEIYWRKCECEFHTLLEHLRAAQQIFPDRWQEFARYPKAHFLCIDFSADWPVFSISTSAGTDEGRQCFGPVPSRRSAEKSCKIIEQAFELCRCPELIDKPQKAKCCQYFQMSACPAPCLGKMSRDEYLIRLYNAAEFLENPAGFIESAKKQMAGYAAAGEYEKAQILKKQIELLEKLTASRDFKWLADWNDFIILHIDRTGEKGKIENKFYDRFTAYLITDCSIESLGDFCEATVDAVLSSLDVKLSVGAAAYGGHKISGAELGLICFCLYRSRSPGIWLRCVESPAADKIIKMMGNC